MTPEEAREVADHTEEASRRIVDAWLADVGHPEVGFVILASVCCQLLARIDGDHRSRFGWALMDDLHVAMGHVYDVDADPAIDPWLEVPE